MNGTRRVSLLVAAAMVGGMVGAVIPALPAAAAVTVVDVQPNFVIGGVGGTLPFGVDVVSLDSAHVYWGNAGTDTIGRADLDGSNPAVFFDAKVTPGDGQEATNGVAVRGNHLYWSNQFTGTIGRADLNGDGPATNLINPFISGGNNTTRLVVTSNHIYWSNNGNDTIGRADLTAGGDLVGGSVNQDFITTGQGSAGDGPVGLAVSSTNIYWANQNSSTIGRADLTAGGDLVGGSVNNSFITTGVNLPAGLAVDAAHIYWANYSLGTISVADINGSNVSVLIGSGSTSSPRGVALDNGYIYWANNNSGSIGRATFVGVPGVPTNVTAVAGNGQGTVTFTPPANDGGSPIASYTVTCTSAGHATGTSTPSLSTNVVVTGLDNGATYTCTVTAHNTTGDGPAGTSNSFVPLGPPGAPTGVTAVAGDGRGTVTFTPPTDNGGSAIQSYTVTCTSAGHPTGTSTPSLSTNVVVTGLDNGATYTCTVKATNALGNSPPGTSNTFVPATVPGAPTGVTAVADNGQGTVTFTPPTDNGGSAIQSYTVTCTSAGHPTGTSTPSLSTNVVVTGLDNGATYTCTVKATNALGNSPPGTSNTFVPATVPDAPAIGAAAAGAPGAIVVPFTPGSDGGSAVASFTATCVSLVVGQPTGSATGTGSPIVVTGLTPENPYSCSAIATNAVGASAASGSSIVIYPIAPTPSGSGVCTATPSAPRTPSAVAEVAPGIAVSWAPPLTGCVAGYIVTPYLHGVAETPTLIPGPGTTTVIKGLIPGSTYTFTVTAENGIAAGPASVMTSSATIGVPGAATALKVKKVAAGALKLSFTAARDNGASVKSYTATCVSSNRGAAKTKAGRTSPITVTGLTAGRIYTCTVKATNSRGTGPSSRTSAAVKV